MDAARARQPSAAAQKERARIAAVLRRRLGAVRRRAKHERLKEAIVGAIIAGELVPGDQLPPEPELAAATGLSLGTVRRCLAKLAADTVVTREHGRGTFVSSHTQSANDFWHLRFPDPDSGAMLPVYTRVLRRSIVREAGPWSRALGEDTAGYVRIERAANVDNRFVCYSDFYVAAETFASILDASAGQIESLGLRKVIAERFRVPSVRARKSVRCARARPDAAAVIGVDPGETVLLVEVTAYTYGDVPVSYQEISVPPDASAMDVSVQPDPHRFKRGHSSD